MRNYLSFSNSKLKQDDIYTFGIPAYRSASGVSTCPNAGECLKGCYARQGFYVMPSVRAAQEARLALALTDDFVDVIDAEIKRRGVKRLRIHDSGDFFSVEYFNRWLAVIQRNPQVRFYAYTKMVTFFKARMKLLPSNFHVIFSEGGTQDSKIDVSVDRHSRVFATMSDVVANGYDNAVKNDLPALNGSLRVGLAYHGAPSRSWTTGIASTKRAKKRDAVMEVSRAG